MSVKFSNYSMVSEETEERLWFDWCVFTDADDNTVNKINRVKYYLHPSFANPIRIQTNREHRFALVSNGWGEFSIAIEIEFLNGTIEHTKHWLKLFQGDNWPRKVRPEHLATSDHTEVYVLLCEGMYRWRKLKTIVEKTGLPEPRVREVLNSLEDDDLARKSSVRSIDGQELWSATTIVGVLPRL
jgi:transcription initiation factor IIF auxiliary subunit